MFLAFRGSSFGTYFIFTAAVLCRVAAVKRLPEYHHSADYIFWSFRIIVLILSQFENRVLLKPVLGGGGGGGRGQCCTITLLHMNGPN